MYLLRLRALFLVGALLLPALGQAWGDVGHRTVAALAEQRLNPRARLAVAELLADEPEASLPAVAVWADEVRAGRADYRWTVPLHWVNFVPGNCTYRRERNCSDGLCVVAAIERFRREIVDPTLPRERRATALKFLVHFVGDIHQPLHAGYVRDRGGNEFQISYRREGWNLHSVWDTLLIQSTRLDWPNYTHRVERIPMTQSSRRALARTEPQQWAEESCRISQARDFYPARHEIRLGYIESMLPIAELRIKLAGERLARLLNATLGR